MNDPLSAFAAVEKPYYGQSIKSWLAQWSEMRISDLKRENEHFLKIVVSWVVQKMGKRRHGGVPIGELRKFGFPLHSYTFNFTETFASQVVLTLRKRGLLEADTMPTDSFRRLVDAFDRCKKI